MRDTKTNLHRITVLIIGPKADTPSVFEVIWQLMQRDTCIFVLKIQRI